MSGGEPFPAPQRLIPLACRHPGYRFGTAIAIDSLARRALVFAGKAVARCARTEKASLWAWIIERAGHPHSSRFGVAGQAVPGFAAFQKTAAR
jgi:hypothetical protein